MAGSLRSSFKTSFTSVFSSNLTINQRSRPMRRFKSAYSEVMSNTCSTFTLASSNTLALVTHSEAARVVMRSEEHTSELQSRQYLVCRLLLEKKKITQSNKLIKYYRRHLPMMTVNSTR